MTDRCKAEDYRTFARNRGWLLLIDDEPAGIMVFQTSDGLLSEVHYDDNKVVTHVMVTEAWARG